MKIPDGAARIITKLEQNGFEAFIVGGCVRDSIIGRIPEDWDITTSAPPAQVKALFRRTADTGLQHGTITVLDGDTGYEVTTYRMDGIYEDHRHPKEVTFTGNLREDLKRRDFTINAMAYSPRTGIIDIFNGQRDLANKLICAVGNAEERFSEDALRMLRAVRFAGQLGFEIEARTIGAIRELAPSIRYISKERIRVEIIKLLLSDGSGQFRLIKDLGLIFSFLPEWTGSGFSLSLISEINRLCKLNPIPQKTQTALVFAALLHENTDAGTAHAICRRLTFDNETVKLTERIIAFRNRILRDNEVQMRFAMNEIGTALLPVLFLFQEAEISVKKGGCLSENTHGQELQRAMLCYEKILSRNDPVTIKDLAIDGKQLKQAGFPSGPEMGKLLQYLIEQVLTNPACNTYDNLINLAKQKAMPQK